MMKPFPALALAAAILPGCLPAAARTADHDGRWTVELVTESGPCGANRSYTVAIEAGQIRIVSGGDGARVDGRVGADGGVGLSVSRDGVSGSGTGRLKAGDGSGTWAVPSLCSGRWTARRSGGRTAQAE